MNCIDFHRGRRDSRGNGNNIIISHRSPSRSPCGSDRWHHDLHAGSRRHHHHHHDFVEDDHCHTCRHPGRHEHRGAAASGFSRGHGVMGCGEQSHVQQCSSHCSGGGATCIVAVNTGSPTAAVENVMDHGWSPVSARSSSQVHHHHHHHHQPGSSRPYHTTYRADHRCSSCGLRFQLAVGGVSPAAHGSHHLHPHPFSPTITTTTTTTTTSINASAMLGSAGSYPVPPMLHGPCPRCGVTDYPAGGAFMAYPPGGGGGGGRLEGGYRHVRAPVTTTSQIVEIGREY